MAGTLGFDDFSGLGIGLPSGVTTTEDLCVVALSVTTAGFFMSTTHLLVSGLGVQCIDELHCNALFGRFCFEFLFMFAISCKPGQEGFSKK